MYRGIKIRIISGLYLQLSWNQEEIKTFKVLGGKKQQLEFSILWNHSSETETKLRLL